LDTSSFQQSIQSKDDVSIIPVEVDRLETAAESPTIPVLDEVASVVPAKNPAADSTSPEPVQQHLTKSVLEAECSGAQAKVARVQGDSSSGGERRKQVYLAASPTWNSMSQSSLYESHIQRLQRRCMELLFENEELRANTEAANQRSNKTQELNLRLGREIQHARRECAAAKEELKRLEAHAQEKSSVQSKRRRSSRQQSTQTTDAQHFTQEDVQCGSQLDSKDRVMALDFEKVLDPALSIASGAIADKSEQKVESCMEAAEVLDYCSHEEQISIMTQEEFEDLTSQVCSCNAKHGWGCALHSVYSPALLLAQREVGEQILLRGPPGLHADGAIANAGRVAHGIFLAEMASLPNHHKRYKKVGKGPRFS
jgi:hypothetical protein